MNEKPQNQERDILSDFFDAHPNFFDATQSHSEAIQSLDITPSIEQGNNEWSDLAQENAFCLSFYGTHDIYLVSRRDMKTGEIISNIDEGDFCGQWCFVQRGKFKLLSFKADEKSEPIGFGSEVDMSKLKWVVDREMIVKDSASAKLLPIDHKEVQLGLLLYNRVNTTMRSAYFKIDENSSIKPEKITIKMMTVRGISDNPIEVVYKIEYADQSYDIPNYGLYL